LEGRRQRCKRDNGKEEIRKGKDGQMKGMREEYGRYEVRK
jgi:hypothetical protein